MYDNNYYSQLTGKSIFSIFGVKGTKPHIWGFWKRKISQLVPNNSTILEVGCGLGEGLERLRKDYKVIGTDISEFALNEIKNNTGLPVYMGDAQKMPIMSNSIDILFAFDVAEHLEKPGLFFSEAYRVLKNEGFVIISVPNPQSLGSRIKLNKEYLTKCGDDSEKHVWFGWRDRTHVSILKIKKWREMIIEAGFKIEKDGTDFPWDIPYTRVLPYILEKLLIIPPYRLLTYLYGYFNWTIGENYVCLAKKDGS